MFASADTANMTKAVRAGLTASDPVNFATNTLTIVTPPGNRAVSRRSPTWRDRAGRRGVRARRCRAATRPSASRI
ncbi:solute-binding protein [Rhodococcus hoagii]|nr:solute-binding protein [Prescottella equi]